MLHAILLCLILHCWYYLVLTKEGSPSYCAHNWNGHLANNRLSEFLITLVSISHSGPWGCTQQSCRAAKSTLTSVLFCSGAPPATCMGGAGASGRPGSLTVKASWGCMVSGNTRKTAGSLNLCTNSNGCHRSDKTVTYLRGTRTPLQQ